MDSILIKDTTREERERIVAESIGNEKVVSVEDDWLTENGLDVGSEWPDEGDICIQK